MVNFRALNRGPPLVLSAAGARLGLVRALFRPHLRGVDMLRRRLQNDTGARSRLLRQRRHRHDLREHSHRLWCRRVWRAGPPGTVGGRDRLVRPRPLCFRRAHAGRRPHTAPSVATRASSLSRGWKLSAKGPGMAPNPAVALNATIPHAIKLPAAVLIGRQDRRPAGSLVSVAARGSQRYSLAGVNFYEHRCRAPKTRVSLPYGARGDPGAYQMLKEILLSCNMSRVLTVLVFKRARATKRDI